MIFYRTISGRCRMTIRKIILLALLMYVQSSALRAVDLVACEGTCHNVTGNVDGHLKVVFTEENGKLAGFVSVTGWLHGGGNITGTRNGTNFQFTTTDRTGLSIKWQGEIKNAKLSGEYFIDAQGGFPRQVGEWSVGMEGSLKAGAPFNANLTTCLLKLVLESGFNDPVKQADGTFLSGAQDVFKSIHPAGVGISIWVENLDVDWKADTQSRGYEDIHKFRLDYVLYWQGVLKPTGTTKLRLAYNTKIDSVTSVEIIESTGTTNKDVNGVLFDVGAFLGKAAVNSLLRGN